MSAPPFPSTSDLNGPMAALSASGSEANTLESLHAVRFAPLPASHVLSPTLPVNQGSLHPSTSPSDVVQQLNSSSIHSGPPSIGTSSVPSTPAALPSEMLFFDASHEHIEIVVPSDLIVLRGVGNNIEPSLFSGQVVLRLSEDTNIREINLNFSGKAKLPQTEARPPSFRQPIATQSVFSRDWSFLEGQKSHRHTLKAGQHVFPFQLDVTDAFPPSVAVGNASVSYRLRATVVRSSFSSNWVAQRDINIIRGFSPEALEYTQTLEIENTWPGKVMYSIMIPHKAVAAGDDIPIALKFTPLVKGCSVLAIEAVIKQYVSVRAKGCMPVQEAKVVAKGNWTVHGGEAIALSTATGQIAAWDVNTAYGRPSSSGASTPATNGLHPTTSRETTASGSSGSAVSFRSSGNGVELGDNELDTSIKLQLPVRITPTNLTDPITVNHKLKWSITLSNQDGHNSELRCALPIHVLSHALLGESRAASQQTRAVLFGMEETEPTQTVLPSYASHVQDRVANALDPLGPLQLAPNPLHNLDLSPVNSHTGTPSPGFPPSASYFATRASTSSHPSTPGTALSHASASGDDAALELVDTGLLLSLGENAQYAHSNAGQSGSSSRTDTPSDSRRSSFRTSRISSSRTSSRATSPEHADVELPTPGVSAPGRSSLFGLPLSLKPFTNLANKHSKSTTQVYPPSSQTPGPTSPRLVSKTLGTRSRQSSHSNLRSEYQGTPGSLPAAAQMESMSQLLNRVPNYERASQGFLGGGVPPLESSAGLPLYQEIDERISRVRSDGALLSMRPSGASEGVYGNPSPELPSEGNQMGTVPSAATTSRPVTAGAPRRRNAAFTLDP